MTIYKYHIFFKGDDIDNVQVRFVAAHDEDEADTKMERYRKNRVKQGVCDFYYINMGVEIDTVIA